MLKTAGLGSDRAGTNAPFRTVQVRAESGTILKSLDEIRELLSNIDKCGWEKALPKGGPGVFLQRAARTRTPRPAPAEVSLPPIMTVSHRSVVMPARPPTAVEAVASSRHNSKAFVVLMAAGLLVLSASSLVVAQGLGLSRRTISLLGNGRTRTGAGAAAAHAVLPPALSPAVAKNHAAAVPLPAAAAKPKPLPVAYKRPAQKPALPRAKAMALSSPRVAAAKPAPAGPARSAHGRSLGESLRRAGDVKIREGDIASARLFYERAADAGDARAAFDLGNSFNPAFLGRLGVLGMRGDAVTAARWYRRARALGSPDAAKALHALPR